MVLSLVGGGTVKQYIVIYIEKTYKIDGTFEQYYEYKINYIWLNSWLEIFSLVVDTGSEVCSPEL